MLFQSKAFFKFIICITILTITVICLKLFYFTSNSSTLDFIKDEVTINGSRELFIESLFHHTKYQVDTIETTTSPHHYLTEDKDVSKENDKKLIEFLFNKNYNSDTHFSINSSNLNEASKSQWIQLLKNKNWALGDIQVFGEIKSNKKYAIYSSSTSGQQALNYLFYLPLTILSWKRIGFGSTIIITGSSTEWVDNQLISFVLQQCVNLEVVLIFVNCAPRDAVRLSQVLRIFAGNILSPRYPNETNVYLLTSDSDLWPLNEHIYIMSSNNNITILSINSDCCPNFQHKNKSYKMLPMASIAMDVKTWCELTKHLNLNLSTSVNDLLNFLIREFGTSAAKPVKKGENQGWYLDQILVSILITRWLGINPNSVQYIPRNTGQDRIDRARWVVGDNIGRKNDAHLLEDGYLEGNELKLLPLLKMMYGVDSHAYRYCSKYFKDFRDRMSV